MLTLPDKLTQLCAIHVDALSAEVVTGVEYISDTIIRLEPTEKESEVAVHCSIIHKHTGGRLSTGVKSIIIVSL